MKTRICPVKREILRRHSGKQMNRYWSWGSKYTAYSKSKYTCNQRPVLQLPNSVEYASTRVTATVLENLQDSLPTVPSLIAS